MRQLMLRAGAAFGLGLCMVVVLPALPAVAEDAKQDPKTDPKSDPKPASDTPPTPTPAPKVPTFPGYIPVTQVVGEVVSADEKTVKLRITWYIPQMKNAKPNDKKPKLSAGIGNYRNPLDPNSNRPQNTPQVTWKEQHYDYDLDYLPQSLVRLHKLPPKLDDKGKKVEYSQKEYDELRAPEGVPAYKAERSDVKPGEYLEVRLIRDKTIAADKVTDADLRIKYAIIWGKDPNPPKDTSPTQPKKN